MRPTPDLVRISKIETQFCSSPEYTQHVQYVSGSTSERRRVFKEERWKKERELGRGSFGVVWLEQCIQGDNNGKLRAVKKVQKLECKNYHRELEAIALFSHSKVSITHNGCQGISYWHLSSTSHASSSPLGGSTMMTAFL
jgi:hypothetical protein